MSHIALLSHLKLIIISFNNNIEAIKYRLNIIWWLGKVLIYNKYNISYNKTLINKKQYNFNK